MSDSPKGNSGNDFAKKVQRQLSRSKEKVLQRLGKTVETRDDQFEHYSQQFSDQQSDGNRLHKDLRSYITAVRDMREASRRLSQSLFDVYESGWVGEDDLGAIVEGEDLLWNDYEVKLLDQAVRTMEAYVGQFPDVKEKIAKRGRKLVDFDSSLHHLESLQNAKKRDDVKIQKAEEERNFARSVYEGLNNELKEELPLLYDSRIGCYVSVFSAVSNLRDIFYKEMSTLNVDLQNVIKELQAQHPDKVFTVRGLQRYGSLKRRTLMSPKAWKSSFSDFHRNYSPRLSQRSSLMRSPEKPRHSASLTRDSSLAGSAHSVPMVNLAPPHSPTDPSSSPPPPQSDHQQEEEEEEKEEEQKEEEEEPEVKPEDGVAAAAPPSDSSSELNQSMDSESLDVQLANATVDDEPLHIEEDEEEEEEEEKKEEKVSSPSKANGMENGDVNKIREEDDKMKEVPVEKEQTGDSKSTTV